MTHNNTRVEHLYEMNGDHHILKPSSALPMTPPSFEEKLPQYFIVRPDIIKHTASGTIAMKGPMVPLVPMDQLPSWLQVVGVPHELDVEQMRGLRNLGEVRKDFDTYEVYLTHTHDNNRGGMTLTANDQCKRQHPYSLEDGQTQKFDPAVIGGHGIGSTKTADNINIKTSGRSGQRTDNSKDRGKNDTPPIYSDSSGRRNASPLSSEASASGSTDSTIAYRLRSKKGIEASRHATTLTNKGPTTPRPPPSSPNVPLRPRILSPPPSPAAPSNPYPLIRRGGPVPPPDHPASRLLSTFTPAGSAYTPTRPSHPNYTGPPSHPNHGSTTHRSNRQSDGRSSPVRCRFWCHHGVCGYAPDCRDTHEMPMTIKGLKAVGLQGPPQWWLQTEEGQELATIMGIGMAREGAANLASRAPGDPGEPRELYHRRDMADEQAKLVGNKQMERYPRRKAKGKGKMKARPTKEGAASFQRILFGEQDFVFDQHETLEARLREAELEDLEMEMEMMEKMTKEEKGVGMGKEKELVDENLMDF